MHDFLDKLFKKPTDSTLIQLFRYFFSGGLAFVADKALFLLFRYGMESDKYVATTIGFAVGLLITYLLSISWIFNERRIRKTWLEFAAFAVIGLVGMALMNLFMWFFSDYVGISSDIVANLFSTVLVTLWNFVAKKYILFSRKSY